MSKRWLINYLLFFLIILFGWLGQPITNPQQKEPILSTQPQEVVSIRIETKAETLAFNKSAEHWFLTAPIQWPASDINLKRITSLVNLEPYSSLPSGEIDLSTLGLRFPNVVIRVNDDVVAFGDSNQIGSRRYVLVNDMVHLVEDNHFPLTTAGLTGFIDKTLLPKSLALTELKLPTLTLTLSAHSAWTVNPKPDNYSADQSNQLIANWQTLESGKIKPYDAKKTPLKKITAKTDKGNIEFYLMSIQPEIVLAREDLGVQYHFDDAFYYDLFSLEKQKRALSTQKSNTQ